MSMEQAILELAAAMREQAAAQRESNEVRRQTAAGYQRAVTAYGKSFGAESDPAPDNAVQHKAAELAEARTESVAAAKEAAAQDAKANEQDDPQMTRAIPREELEAALKAAKEKAELDKAVDQVEQAALDYKKDVYPVLLQVSKSKGKEALAALLKKHGAKTGDTVATENYPAIIADGNALLAG